MATDKALVTIIWEEDSVEYGTEDGIEKDGKTRKFPLPEPTAYSGATTTMVDSGTSVSGHLLGSLVRSDVAQISLSWNYLEAAVWAKVNQQFKERYINQVLFFDQTKGDWEEREMYISDRSAGLWRRNANGDVLGWTGCSLQLTEV
ncbi:MAG TPA: hypothetical protein DEB31_10220 [Clostridiales bacterium]|nr:hypothetical protein [Clostridiales bacterium]